MARHNHRHHVHRRDHEEAIERRQDTVVSVVFVTAAKTFDGPIGGYKTLDGPERNAAPAPSPQPEPQQQQQPAPQQQQQFQSTQQQEQPQSTQQQPSTQPSPSPEPATSSPPPPAVKTTPTEPSSSPKTAAATSTEATRRAAQSPEASSPTKQDTETPSHGSHTSFGDPIASSTFNSGASPTDYAVSSSIDSSASASTSFASSITKEPRSGMSGGAKAGLALGIILVVGALIALAAFLIRRKKQRNDAYEKTVDEKAGLGAQGVGIERSASVATTKTSATAPRLSIRPVTQFLPDLAGKGKSGNLLGGSGGASGASFAVPSAHGGKPAMREQAANPANPFGTHAEMSEKASAHYVPNNTANPFSNEAEVNRQLASADSHVTGPPTVPAPLSIRSPSPVSLTSSSVGAGVGAGLAAAGATTHTRQDAPKPLTLSPNRTASPGPGQPSPAGTEFSMTSISPSAVGNGAPPSNVHRVQLDFKPSMDDELGLRAGQLVRLLHEYDDGWVSQLHTHKCRYKSTLTLPQVLCIRLDRSQQGVAPRTCLSARPVKPRPPPGARGGPPPRGPPPPGSMYPNQQPRPSSPAMSGRGSPSPYDRPRPQGQQRSMSPGPYGGGPQQRPTNPHPANKRRGNSASQVRERHNSPPGPSPMNPNHPDPGPMQGTQRVLMQMQAVVPPGHVLPLQQQQYQTVKSPAGSVGRKPVPGQAI